MIPHLARGGSAIRPARGALPAASVGGEVTLRSALRAAAVLLAGAGVVHAGFAPAHSEHLLQGAFFLGAAAFQVGGAVVVLRSRSRSAVAFVIDGNASIVILWALSRLAGPVLFPAASWTERLGYADTLCTVLEIAGIALLALASRPSRPTRAVLERSLPGPVALMALASMGFALVPLVGHALSTVGAHHEAAEICASDVCAVDAAGTAEHGH